MNKCIGCGVELQTKDNEKLGFTKNIENNLCERCFRIQNYGEYQKINKSNEEYKNILEEINKTKDLVVLVVDIFNITEKINKIKEYIKNDIILVITKKDILPKSTKDEKLIEYIKKYNINPIETIVISSTKNYNFDRLYEAINENKKSKNVYIIGFTNAGKSTMLNKIIYNYSNSDTKITTSILPSTTLDKIEIKLNDNLTLIDTPGLLYEKSFYDILEGKELKKIIPKKEIKPLSYQIKEKQYILIDKYAILEVENMNIILFTSNTLNIKKQHKKPITNLKEKQIKINNNDLVINGLGFVKCIGEGKIKIYINDEISVTTRKHLI